MADVFTELGSLSRTLQTNDLILPKASAELQRTVSELEGMKLRCKPGGMLEKFLSMKSEGESVIFQGMELKWQVTMNDSVFRNLHGAAAVDIAVKEMRLHFMRFLSQSGHGVVYSSRIFNHDAWPERQDAPLDYGRGEIQVLIQHFGLEPTGNILQMILLVWIKNGDSKTVTMPLMFLSITLLTKWWMPGRPGPSGMAAAENHRQDHL